MQKPQMKSGTYRDYFSDAKHAVAHAQNNRSCVGPIETCNSVPKDAVLQSKSTDEGGDP